MQRYADVQSPFDPFSGQQISYTRYTGYRRSDFYYQGREMTGKEKARAKFFGAFVCIGFLCLTIVEVLSA